LLSARYSREQHGDSSGHWLLAEQETAATVEADREAARAREVARRTMVKGCRSVGRSLDMYKGKIYKKQHVRASEWTVQGEDKRKAADGRNTALGERDRRKMGKSRE
jgi:hypothetical protein